MTAYQPAACQPGILKEDGGAGLFLVLNAVSKNGVSRKTAGLPAITDAISAMDAAAGLTCVVAYGAAMWDAIGNGTRPKGLRPFKTVSGPKLSAPATGGDILLHINSARHDLNFELARALLAHFGDTVIVMESVRCFVYMDSRDMTGFIDGTANPKEDGERREAALIGAEDPAFAGGSYVLTQRYVHNLAAWEKLSVHEQEMRIGRRKKDSEELPEGIKPPTAHISRVEIKKDGQELKIVRHSMPYGRPGGDAGLFFIAYARDPGIFESMLAAMFGAAGDGRHDHLMDFTSPVSGAFFFAPPLKMLAAIR